MASWLRLLPSSLEVCQVEGNWVGIKCKTEIPSCMNGTWSSATELLLYEFIKILAGPLLTCLSEDACERVFSICFKRLFNGHVLGKVQINRAFPLPIRSSSTRTFWNKNKLDKELWKSFFSQFCLFLFHFYMACSPICSPSVLIHKWSLCQSTREKPLHHRRKLA